MSAWNAAESIDFRGPLDVTRAATAVLDSQDTVIGWSPAAEELLGYPPHEILGQPLDTVLVGRLALEPAPGGRVGPMCRTEGRVARHHDGHVLTVATTLCALADAGAGPAQILVATELGSLRHWDARQAMLHGLATRSPIGLAIYDTDLRLEWANAASGRELGVPFGDCVGMHAGELYPGGEVLSEEYPPTLELVMRYVLATGEPVLNLLFRGRPPNDPDHRHVWSCSYYRLQDAHDQPLGVCEDGVDITDRYRDQERLDLMVRAGSRIGTTLDMTATAREITEVAVPQFADSVAVDLVAGVLEGEEPHPGDGPVRTLVRVAERSAPRGGESGSAGGRYAAGGEAAGGSGVTGDGASGAGENGVGENGVGEPVTRPVRYPAASPQARGLTSGRTVLENGAGAVKGTGTAEEARTAAGTATTDGAGTSDGAGTPG
ncbi:PAS domain-containing protein [Streptomyces sp. NPDC001922]|uniref:PAS domain-containing protein n=1 Tax=Streptomyces sp. NPDC001922 TaxID=3364624 RepID=UPI003685E71A